MVAHGWISSTTLFRWKEDKNWVGSKPLTERDEKEGKKRNEREAGRLENDIEKIEKKENLYLFRIHVKK